MTKIVFVVALAFAFGARAQSFPGGPFAVSGLGGKPNTITGTCATTNGVGEFSGASTLACAAGFTWDGTTLSLPPTLSLPADVAVALGGGVDGLNIDSNTLSIDATNHRVGIRTAAPDSALNVVAGTLASSTNYGLHLTATASSGQNVINFVDATSGGNNLDGNVGWYVALEAGYTAAGPTKAYQGDNLAAGTCQTPLGVGTNVCANLGLWGSALATTVGANVGALGKAIGSTYANYGFGGVATLNTTGANVGVAGHATNATGVETGGYFYIGGAAEPSQKSGGIVVDNTTEALPIAVLRDNGTDVYVIQDGGLPDSRGVSAVTDAGTGSCTGVTVSGNNVRGTITATCLAGQTVVLTFGSPAWPAAPICVFGAGGEQTATSTTSTTVKGDVALTGGKMTYYCTD